jgi:hypothetical protein
MFFRLMAVLALASGISLYGQTNDGPFQVRYASNLVIGDSVINISNDGASSPLMITGGILDNPQNGNLCVNVYTYTPDEQLSSCCSCFVTPNGMVSLSVRNDLVSNPLTPIIPTSVVIKLLATSGDAGAATCNAAQPGQVRPGMLAWGTTLHPLPATPGSPATTWAVVETRFSVGNLVDPEFTRLQQLCGFIKANGSGYGVCKSCRFGGLGAASK